MRRVRHCDIADQNRTAQPRRRLAIPALPLAARMRLAGFARDEDGTVGWFSLMLFCLMLVMGGMAVDLMRHEYTRTALQQLTDRSALAAASLNQELDAQDVVADYFAKAGMSDYLDATNVDEGLNYRTVAVASSIPQRPFLMPLIGVDTLPVPAAGTAEERIGKVEISLVLDISRSMILTASGASGNEAKFNNVKSAAKSFVEDVLSYSDDDDISISIVPYNGQVNLADGLYSRFNVTYKPGITNVQCVDLPSTAYATTGISSALELPATGFVDPYSSSSTSSSYVAPTNSSYATPNELNRWCPNYNSNKIQLPSNDVATLESKIDGLQAIGATSINAGVKWGLTLLDPGSRTIFSSLISSGDISSEFEGRPYDYDEDDTMKVIVLMTDGSHFEEYRLKDAYRTGASPIYYDSTSGYYSIYHSTKSGSNKYYVPATNTWQAAAYVTTTSTKSCTTSGKTQTCTTTTTTSTAVQQTWQQIWSSMRLTYVAQQFYVRALGTSLSTQLNAMREVTATSTMDTQLQAICSLAKNQGVIIYGIAFEAPTAGQAQIAQCSTQTGNSGSADDSNYYFEADGDSIGTDFKTIAANISQLRLTQ